MSSERKVELGSKTNGNHVDRLIVQFMDYCLEGENGVNLDPRRSDYEENMSQIALEVLRQAGLEKGKYVKVVHEMAERCDHSKSKTPEQQKLEDIERAFENAGREMYSITWDTA